MFLLIQITCINQLSILLTYSIGVVFLFSSLGSVALVLNAAEELAILYDRTTNLEE